MLYKPYGSTGLSVSALGFGGMRFENQEDVDGCAALVKACYDAGITYFDTAIGYGKSEERMGVAFKEMRHTRAQRPFYVATKTFSATADDVRRELRASFDSLCTGCGYCDSCPQGLPVPKLMDAYNQFALSGKPENMAQRMNWHWGLLRSGHHLDDCTACGQCERACTQKLPIIARLKDVRESVAKAVAAADAKG